MLAELAGTFSDPSIPVVVNSAGCGSWMRDATDSQRFVDASVFLQHAGLGALLAESKGLCSRLTYHDACHLAHGQGVRAEPRELLKAIPGIEYFELGEADRCCGSAGIYNVIQPEMARTLLDRKWSHVEASGAEIVALGNPGCHGWIAQAAREKGGHVRVLHTMEVLEAAFSGL